MEKCALKRTTLKFIRSITLIWPFWRAQLLIKRPKNDIIKG